MTKHFENPTKSPVNFLNKRLWRLYPTFWGCLTITTIGLLFLFPDISITAKQYLFNLTMISSNLGEPLIDGAYWTMAYELKFALILFILFVLTRKIRIRRFLILVWLISSIFLGAYKDSLPYNIVYLGRGIFISDMIQMFICGMCLFAIRQKNSYYILVLILCFVNQYFWFGLRSIEGYFLIVTSIILMLMPYLEGVDYPAFLYNPIKFIATISYPLYLIHQMIGYGVIRWFKHVGIENEIILIIPLAVSILLAYAIHCYIEIPCSNFDFSKRIKIFLKNVF